LKRFKEKISVIGLGYIGLPTSIILANSGHRVCGVDNNNKVIEKCKKGELHIVEPGLKPYFEKALDSKNLSFSNQLKPSDIYIICVPTPFIKNKESSKLPDISYIESVAKQISKIAKEGDVIILESTSPVGTTNKVKEIIASVNKDKKLFFAYCPERVLPGNIMKEIVENDRIVGGIDKESTKIVSSLYRSFVKGNIHETQSDSAELSKLIENSYRDVNIAFANEISMYCDKKDIDHDEVIELANKHPRVNIMSPGVGVGGHCIAVDPWFLVADDQETTTLINRARRINDYKTEWAYKKILDHLKDHDNPTIAVFGLSYKPDIDDLRESPSMKLAKYLKRRFKVVGVEPNISDHDEIELMSIDQAIVECDFAVVCVPHKEFLETDFSSKLNSKPHLAFCKLKYN